MGRRGLPDERYLEERHTYLCVGGPFDGQRYVPSKFDFTSGTSFRVRGEVKREPLGPDVLSVAQEPLPQTSTVTMWAHVYHRETLRVKTRFGDGTIEYVFWRSEGLDTIDALTELFKGYKGKDQR